MDDTLVEPEIKSVSITGVPATTTIVVDGETSFASFTFDYSFEDAAFVPISVECIATTDGTSTVTATKIEESNKFKVDIENGVVAEKISVKVVIDTVSSVTRSSTLQD